MPGGGLTPETVVALLTGPDRLLEETAWWIAGRHPEWGGALSRFFEARLSTAQSKDSSQVLVDKLAQLGPNAAIQELLAKTVEQHSLKEARLDGARRHGQDARQGAAAAVDAGRRPRTG